MKICTSCDGFVPMNIVACPHCAASKAGPNKRLPGFLLAATLAGGMSWTACSAYGLPPCEEADDADQDGFFGEQCYPDQVDCDDTDADVYPGAPDPEGDDIDQNCDGVDGDIDNTGDGGAPDGG